MKMDNTMLIGLAVVVLIVLVLGWNMYSNSDTMYPQPSEENILRSDGVENYENSMPRNPAQPVGQPTNVEQMDLEEEKEEFTQASTCYPKDSLTPDELLPQDYSSTWAKCNPMGAGGLEGKNFLDAGHHIGINTVGQVLRNANLSLRSEPPNPTVVISPFNQSTIAPDTSRRYFEVGSC